MRFLGLLVLLFVGRSATWTSGRLPLENVSKGSFKRNKHKFRLTGLVQIHHIIPREFASHPLIVAHHYPMERGANLMFMPTIEGTRTLNTVRPCHEGGHLAYNEYVGASLSRIATSPYSKTQRGEALRRLVWYLRLALCTQEAHPPWRDGRHT